MDRHNPPAQRWSGAVAKVELDGSVTLYGIEDWTDLDDVPVFRAMSHADAHPEDHDEKETDPGS